MLSGANPSVRVTPTVTAAWNDTPPLMWLPCKSSRPHHVIDRSDRDHGVPLFCLHVTCCPTVAGMVCSDCGTVMSNVNAGAESVHAAVSLKIPEPSSTIVTGAEAVPAARQEWDTHTRALQDQPSEVLQNAWVIFQRVYSVGGAVSGVKARALVLVSLLYSSRLLHGANSCNEESSLKRLATPSRIMNKAVTESSGSPGIPGFRYRWPP